MKKTKIALLCSSVFATFPYVAFAEETADLDEVVVQAGNFSQQIGTQKITEKQIARQPATNGNITDLLKTNPNVRFSATSENANEGGEIKPSEISFHGEKFYNNNFIVNGMSNNDNLNPGSDVGRLDGKQPAGTNAYDLPGGDTQSFWIDSSLLKSVEVFDSNISAKYGNFSGGVVDAQFKDPSLEKWNSGKIYYRRTQDEWAEFHVDPDTTFEKANRLDFQPEYTKQQYGISMDQKLSEKASMRFSYTKTESDIDYYHPLYRERDANGNLTVAGEQKQLQKRIAETYMLNGIYLPDNGDLWRATLIYAPHSAKYFKANTKNGAFKNTGGGVQANVEWEKQLTDSLKMKSYLGYKKSGNHVEHDASSYHGYRQSAQIGWVSGPSGIANEGGFGSFKNEKTTYTAKQDFELNEFDWGETRHKFIFGWQVDLARAKYMRENDANNYTYNIPNYFSTVCNGVEACIDGDGSIKGQYAWRKARYYARSVKGSDNAYSAYVEDTINWKRLTLSTGLRVDHNQFLGKTNFAPRVSASYDLFGDQSTRLFTGFNRYYNGSMLAYKLRQSISQYEIYERNQYQDGTIGNWLKPGLAYNNNYDVSKLENPYSDEIVLGLGQKVLNTNWVFKWVHRDSRKQFVKKSLKNGERNYTTLTNDGWSENDTFTISVSPEKRYEFKYANVSWDASFSYNKTKTNTRWYGAEEMSTTNYLIYNDRLYYQVGGITPQDFNNPYKISFNLNTEFPTLRLSWDQRFSYTGGKDYIYQEENEFQCNGTSTVGERKTTCGTYVGPANVYKDAHQSSHFLVDWRFTYKQPTVKDQFVELTLDVNNVLDKKAVAKSAGGNTVYKMGRNFWLGASYNW